MGAQMDVAYIRSPAGLIQTGQVVLAVIGGVIGLLAGGGGFFGFVFWSTAILTSLFLALAVFNMMPALVEKFPIVSKIHLGYVAVWTLFYIIGSVLSFISFNLSAILVYVLLCLFFIDLFQRYRSYKSGSGADATASNPTATEASGGEVPKY